MKKIIQLLLLVVGISVNAQDVVLPFSLHQEKHILLKLPTETPSDSLVFYFDTGAVTTLLDKRKAESKGIKANYQQEIQGASGKKIYDIALNQKINLTSECHIEAVNIVLEDLSRLSNSLGEDFDGIIGNDIVKKFITKIDFQKKQIELYNPDTKINTEGYIEIPFIFKNNIPIPQFPISVTLENGEVFSGDIFFDSGAGLSLLVNTPFKEENQMMNKIGKYISKPTNNLTDKTDVITTRIKSLTISDFTFEDLTIDFASNREGVSAAKGYLGILGAEIINRFDIILDYASLKLYIKPNYLYHNPFKIPVSPIKLARSGENIVISGVVKNSEAEIKGLKEEQKIISINGISSKNIETYRNMLEKENTTVKIKYRDDNETKTVKFKLNKLL